MTRSPLGYLVLTGLLAGGLFLASSTSGSPPQGATPQVAQYPIVEYAELSISRAGYTFTPSGSNVRPRTYDLDGLYRFLGGSNNPTFVNLLGEIGADGWKLVDVDPQRTVYLFVR